MRKGGLQAINNDLACGFVSGRYRFVMVIDAEFLFGNDLAGVMFEDCMGSRLCKSFRDLKFVLKH